MTSVDYDWRRYALIAELADQVHQRGGGFGKTALQKLVYFLQELQDVDLGYEFSLYTYGPFCSALVDDLDTARELGAVEVKYLGPLEGYDIFPGPSTSIREKAKGFIDQKSEQIRTVVADFGRMWAKELELRATIVYVERDAHRSGQQPAEDFVVSTVRDLKPHFSADQVRIALRQLGEKRYVTVA